MIRFHSHDSLFRTVNGLDQTQRVHRIVDFFSAAQVVDQRELYIPLALKFEDLNEGIDTAIDVLSIAAGPCSGISKTFNDHSEFVEYQKNVAGRTYVSSWTQTKESVAMWALYSPDHSSVQITTNIGSLEQAALNSVDDHADPRPAIRSGGKPGQFLDKIRMSKVRYDDLESIARKIERRRRAYAKASVRLKTTSMTPSTKMSVRDEYRADQYSYAGLELKDTSFAHESEVRLILEYVPFTSDTLAIASNAMQEMDARVGRKVVDSHYEESGLAYARALLRERAFKKGHQCADSIMLPLPQEFVMEVTIDPRCSFHKRNFIQSYFEQRGIRVAESTCFRHAANNFVIFPRN